MSMELPPWQATMAEERARVKRRVNAVLGWIVFAIYSIVVVVIMVTIPTWTNWMPVGVVLIAVYGLIVFVILGVRALYRDRTTLEPTEWMRRGGLMAAPNASARPDEGRINAVLAQLPEDVAAGIRHEVEAYLAMPDDDAKQLCRDRLIRAFYARASSSRDDFIHRKAYNEVRLALSPWADMEG